MNSLKLLSKAVSYVVQYIPDNLDSLIEVLDEVAAEWESFGIKLEVPYHELNLSVMTVARMPGDT